MAGEKIKTKISQRTVHIPIGAVFIGDPVIADSVAVGDFYRDIDNTLIQSSRGHVEALLLSITEVYGLDASIKVINHHGMTDQEIITRLLEEYGIDPAQIKAGLKDCMESMSRRYAEIVNSEEIDVMEGVFASRELVTPSNIFIRHRTIETEQS